MGNMKNLKDIVDANLEKLDLSEQAKKNVFEKSNETNKFNSKKCWKLSATPAVAILIVITIVCTNLFWVKTPVKLQAQDLKADINNFSINLLKQSISKDENTLISPTSIYLALGMTANGAAGETLKQFEHILGEGTLTLSELNQRYYDLAQNLQDFDSGKMKIANSIWYRNDPTLQIKPEFLQTNADYFSADAFKTDFASPKTVDDINGWVKNNTDGLIDNVIDTIDPFTVMYLLNTVLFDAEWSKVYTKESVRSGDFKTFDDTNVAADFMYSTENSYIKDHSAQGFIKPYKGDKFSLVGILPNEGVDLQKYVNSLNGTKFQDLINSKITANVSAGIPKFKYNFQIELKEPLENLGLKNAFDGSLADFSNMAMSSSGNFNISRVLHKTFIQVDELGTKAGAVTDISLTTKGIVIVDYNIILDRPFLYAIIDNETGLPIFIGTVMNPVQ